MKILILKPSSLGDIIQALPVLRLIKLQQPASEVYWWISKSLAPVLQGDPQIAGLILFDRQGWANPLHWDDMARSIQGMRAHRFDCVIDLQSLFRSGLFAWLTHGRFTIGLDDFREGAPAFYDVAIPRPSFHTHAVDWYLSVLPYLGISIRRDFDWLPPRSEVLAAFQQRWHPPRGRRVVIVPGARWNNKRWPVSSFKEIVRLILAREPATRFALIGSAADQELTRGIASVAPEACSDLAGKTNLSEMIEWIRWGEVMISNDTGPMHVAAALGVPVVAIFGPTDPRRTGPYGQVENTMQHLLPCVPCMESRCHWATPLACLHGITPFSVANRTLDHLNR